VEFLEHIPRRIRGFYGSIREEKSSTRSERNLRKKSSEEDIATATASSKTSWTLEG